MIQTVPAILRKDRISSLGSTISPEQETDHARRRRRISLAGKERLQRRPGRENAHDSGEFQGNFIIILNKPDDI
jgi:hypothetical protein